MLSQIPAPFSYAQPHKSCRVVHSLAVIVQLCETPRFEVRLSKQRKTAHSNALPPLKLLLLWVLLFFSFLLFPVVRHNSVLLRTFVGVGICLSLSLLLLARQVASTGRKLSYRFEPKAVHYVQFMMHSVIYTYWGWYWPEVYRHIPLILAQVVFAYSLNMLLGWARRDIWILGFGPIPIIFSTNLFMWFRDDWFYFQFMMVAAGVFGKEFITWQRDGRRTHIFNPSALGLFVFSVGLILTHSTKITWGESIALTFYSPPHMYLAIFCVGLVVQALFSVTLVTLSAAAALYILNLIFTHTTGVYYFIDSGIPPAVFLGLHLLVTDPATSPRSTSGKLLFGAAYGGSVFGLYTLLAAFGAPTFYDKLLCIPPLNLTVRIIDHVCRKVDVWFSGFLQRSRSLVSLTAWSPKKLNYAFMSIWIALFFTMTSTGFLVHDHPGKNMVFWEDACHEGRYHGCRTWVNNLTVSCSGGVRESCLAVAQLKKEGKYAPLDLVEAAKGFGHACDLGLSSGCSSLAEFAQSGGGTALEQSCGAGDGVSCFLLGYIRNRGLGVAKDDNMALEFFSKSCSSGFPRGCSRLGESYFYGEGTRPDLGKAMQFFETACQNQFALGCMNAGQLYLRGYLGARNEDAARARFQQACGLGFRPACDVSPAVPVSRRTASDTQRGN